MKKSIIIKIMFILAIAGNSTAYCQSFSMATYTTNQSYSPTDFSSPQKDYRRMCVVTKVGLISLGAGIVFFGIGNVVRNSSDDNGFLAFPGIAWFLAGLAIAPAGLCVTIGGGIHDIVNHHKHKLSLIVPQRKQLGFAYNF